MEQFLLTKKYFFHQVFVHQEYFLKALVHQADDLAGLPNDGKVLQALQEEVQMFWQFVFYLHNNEICVLCCFVCSWVICQLHNVIWICWCFCDLSYPWKWNLPPRGWGRCRRGRWRLDRSGSSTPSETWNLSFGRKMASKATFAKWKVGLSLWYFGFAFNFQFSTSSCLDRPRVWRRIQKWRRWWWCCRSSRWWTPLLGIAHCHQSPGIMQLSNAVWSFSLSRPFAARQQWRWWKWGLRPTPEVKTNNAIYQQVRTDQPLQNGPMTLLSVAV